MIGIDDYQHPRVPKLGFAVNDARAVQDILLEQGFRQDHIVALFNGDATTRRIEGILGDDLRQRVGPNDRVLVFFAGHGKTDKLRSGEDEGYLIPVDGDPARLFANAISMTSLRQISERLPAKHILFIVDACYSGYAIYNRAVSDALLDEMVRKPAICAIGHWWEHWERSLGAGAPHGAPSERIVCQVHARRRSPSGPTPLMMATLYVGIPPISPPGHPQGASRPPRFDTKCGAPVSHNR